MHEHIARVMYYCSVHLLYASVVGAAAWVLTSIRSASATTKYWIWVLTAFNFIVPVGATVDKVWALHLGWAEPLSAHRWAHMGHDAGPNGRGACRDMDGRHTRHANAVDRAPSQRKPRSSNGAQLERQ